jgi:hypothetical protein
MTSRWLTALTVLGVLLAFVIGIGAQRFHRSGPSQQSGYSADLSELKKRFNADKKKVLEAYKTILPTKNAETGAYIKAWDVYLVFKPGIEWKDKPPTPSFWMHQLYSADPKNAFDSKALATQIQKLLK